MYYKILVYPDARHDAVIPPKKNDGRYSIYTKAPARDNRANDAVLILLGAHLAIDPKRLRIIKGHRSPQKIIQHVD